MSQRRVKVKEISYENTTHSEMVSFQTGFKVERIVLVFFLTLSASGISFILTYGSLKPLGSIGIKLRPCFTGKEDEV